MQIRPDLSFNISKFNSYIKRCRVYKLTKMSKQLRWKDHKFYSGSWPFLSYCNRDFTNLEDGRSLVDGNNGNYIPPCWKSERIRCFDLYFLFFFF